MYIKVSLLAGLDQAPQVSGHKERGSDVVWELLEYSSDKAYGKRGAVSSLDFGVIWGWRCPRGSWPTVGAGTTGLKVGRASKWSSPTPQPLHQGPELVPTGGLWKGPEQLLPGLGVGEGRHAPLGGRPGGREGGAETLVQHPW